MQNTWRRLGTSVGTIIVLLMLMLLVSGCTSESILPKDESYMTQTEEKKVKEAAIQYIKNRYNKGFEVKQVSKDHVFGGYYIIEGYMEDGKNTQVYITGNPPNDFDDTYVARLWENELEPRIKGIAEQSFDLRLMKPVGYSSGKKRAKYTGEVPSVYEVLKNGGDQDFELNLDLGVYPHNGKFEEDISKFLNELRKMNFNNVTITVYVYKDELKNAPKNADSDNYLIYRYNISGDIQKIDINNLDQYKTVIKH